MACVMMTACAGGGGGPEPPPPRDAAFFADLHYDIPASEVSTILQNPTLSDYVKDVVRDGTVTFGEYETSVLDTVACLQDLGAEVRTGDPRLSARGLYTWMARGPDLRDPTDAAEQEQQLKAVVGCLETYWSQIDFYWNQVVQPTDREKSAAMEDMAACLEESGIPETIPPSRAYEAFEALMVGLPDETRGLYWQCAHKVQDKWALPKFIDERWE